MQLLFENDFVQVFERPDEQVISVVRSAERGEPSVLLVSTAVGKLQAGRVARESGRASSVTQDEAEAMRWAAGRDWAGEGTPARRSAASASVSREGTSRAWRT